MKIIFFVASLEAGGAERAVINISRIISENLGYRVILITGKDQSSDFYRVPELVTRLSLDFNYTKVGVAKIFELVSRLKKFNESIDSNDDEDLWILVSSDLAILHSFNFIGSRKRLVIWEHNNYYGLKSKLKRALRVCAYSIAERIIVLTNRDVIEYKSRPFINTRLTVIPNPIGVECQSYKPILERSTKKLLAVGRLAPQKGFHEMLSIMKLLDESYSLTILGDGYLREELIENARSNGLSNRVHFVGSQSNIAEFYDSHSLLIMTSIYEGLPMVIVEANSFGMPVIAFDCPTGPRELIEHGVTGFVVEVGDRSGFASYIVKITTDNALLKSLSDNARKSTSKYSGEYISSYWQLLIENN